MCAKRAANLDALVAYQFSLDITEGPVRLSPLYFSELSGLGVEYQVIEHKTFSEKGLPLIQLIPGRPTYAPVTLKRGVTTDLSLWQWHRMVYSGQLEQARASVSITMYDGAYKAVFMWSLMRAWPSKLSGLQFSASSSDFLMQELTLVYEGIEEQKLGGGG